MPIHLLVHFVSEGRLVRLTLSQAKRRKCPLYWTGHKDRYPVLCWRRWGSNVHLQVVGGCYVVSRSTILETEGR